MSEFFRSRFTSFKHAFSGLRFVIRTQKNAWIHAFISIIILLVCGWLGIPASDWATIILTIALVWAAEFFNTSLEAMVDLASPEQNNLAQISKDVGAAAVLIASTAAVIIGLLILGPALWYRLF